MMLSDLESKAASGDAFTRVDAERVLSCPDLVAVGRLGAAGRKARHGGTVSYGRVTTIAGGVVPAERGEAGEVRLVGVPASADEAVAWVRAAAGFSGDVPLTGFSLADLVTVAGGDHMVLVELAQALKANGLDGVASAPIDALGDDPAEIVRAAQHAGVAVRRATFREAGMDGRLALIERAVSVQRETGAFAALAPLPEIDPVETPSTGYDDVKTIAVARLMAAGIPHLQVDWTLYGPKLAQVAIEYGADDLDGIAAVDIERLGQRRSPKTDIERQIRSAFAEPVERTGRYERRA